MSKAVLLVMALQQTPLDAVEPPTASATFDDALEPIKVEIATEISAVLARWKAKSAAVRLADDSLTGAAVRFVEQPIVRWLMRKGIPVVAREADVEFLLHCKTTGERGRYLFELECRRGTITSTTHRKLLLVTDWRQQALFESLCFDASRDTRGHLQPVAPDQLTEALGREPDPVSDPAVPTRIRQRHSDYALEVRPHGQSRQPEFEVEEGYAFFDFAENESFGVALVNDASYPVVVELYVDGVNVWEQAARLGTGPETSRAALLRLGRRKFYVPARGETFVPGWFVGDLPRPDVRPFAFRAAKEFGFGQVTAIFYEVPAQSVESWYRDPFGLSSRTRDRVAMLNGKRVGLDNVPFHTLPVAAVSAVSFVLPAGYGGLAGRFLADPPPSAEAVEALVRQGAIREAFDRIAHAATLDDETLTFLGRSLASQNKALRTKTIDLVFKHSEFETIFAKAVLPVLRDGTDPQRKRVLEVFHRAKVVLLDVDDTVAAEVEALCRSENDEVRIAAFTALPNLNGTHGPSVEGLAKLLGSEDPEIRREAAERLGRFGRQAKSAIPALLPLLNDEEESVVAGAVDAIRRITRP